MFARFLISVTLVVLASATGALSAERASVSYAVQSSFDDVVFELENAVVDEGLIIDYMGQINDMLERTSETVGLSENGEKSPYVGAVYMHFCSALLTHEALSVDPANLAICPYIVFAYETHAEPGVVNVGYRRPIAPNPSKESDAALAKIEALLERIVKSVSG